MRITLLLFLLASVCWAQSNPPAAPKTPAPGKAPAPAVSGEVNDITGMYSFLRDGEFVQINVENDGRVTGFISRYADAEKNAANFVDQFFDKASLTGDQLTFSTKTVHGISYAFQGTAGRGPGKTPNDVGYLVLKGTLTETATDAAGKASSRARQVEFQSFPADTDEPGSEPD